MSITKTRLVEKIKKRKTAFTWDYDVDPVKAAISACWPDCMDDACAREEGGWNTKWDMDQMIDDMLKEIAKKVL